MRIVFRRSTEDMPHPTKQGVFERECFDWSVKTYHIRIMLFANI